MAGTFRFVLAWTIALTLSASGVAPAEDPNSTSRLLSDAGDGPLGRTFLQEASRPPPDTLRSDRPDLADTSSTLGWGYIQLEGGYTFLYDRAEQTTLREHLLPELLLRIGLGRRTELRLGWPGIAFTQIEDRQTGATTDRTGGTDLDLGAKFLLFEQHGLVPQTALTTSASIPIGDDAFSAHRIQPLVSLAYSWQLTERWTVGGSTGLATLKEFEDHLLEMHQSLTAYCRLSERWGTYAEWLGFFRAESADDRPQYLVDGGITFLVTENLQLDWRVGFGLNDRANDFFTGAGFSLRF